MPQVPARYIGLDIHKRYLVAVGVDRDQNQVFGPQRVEWPEFEDWIRRRLTAQDAVVIEMTTNTWEVYDTLIPHVQSVTVVHPPDVAMIVKARVMTDKKAALILAQLHAAHLLPAVWVPPADVRDLRALIAQRKQMVTMIVITRSRLHGVLHRHHFLPPEGQDLFAEKTREWWLNLPVSAIERLRIESDLETLAFARQQKARLEEVLAQLAAKDERVPLLAQFTGVGLITAMTILGAIGDIKRFPNATKLVGYAGLGASVHSSGQTHSTGPITKSGRRDLRAAMVEIAFHAIDHHPHWKAEFARLEPRLGRNKAQVAIARKLLVAIWHVLTNAEVDRFGVEVDIAKSMFRTAYRLGVANLPDGQSAREFTRNQLDRLGIGQDLTEIPWGTKRPKLPPSKAAAPSN